MTEILYILIGVAVGIPIGAILFIIKNRGDGGDIPEPDGFSYLGMEEWEFQNNVEYPNDDFNYDRIDPEA